MKVLVTEYLRIDLESEQWECRRCQHGIGSARANYKEGLMVYERDPRTVHKPVIDPERYEYTFSPDPKYCTIYEFYCPCCGTLVETEYQAPGHEPVHDIDFDIDSLKAQWSTRREVPDVSTAAADDSLAGGRMTPCNHSH
jgi:acetone carboxylase gamma subunit